MFDSVCANAVRSLAE